MNRILNPSVMMQHILLQFFGAFLYVIPAGVATMLPPLAARWTSGLSTPLDFGRKLGGKPVFGKNKTWRGLVVGCLGGVGAALLEFRLIDWLAIQHLSSVSLSVSGGIALFGFLSGFGAIVGDAIKSFFKRRVDIEPGVSWFPFDQIDWVVGLLVFTYPLVHPSLQFILVTFFISLVLHLIVKFIGYIIGVNSSPI